MKSLKNLNRKTVNNLIILWKSNQAQILFLIILIAFLIILRTLPYFNIYLTPALAIVSWWVIFVIIYKIKSKYSVFIAAVLLSITAIAVCSYHHDLADSMANSAYIIFVIAFLQYLFEIKNENQ
jgi:hypothetical protein